MPLTRTRTPLPLACSVTRFCSHGPLSSTTRGLLNGRHRGHVRRRLFSDLPPPSTTAAALPTSRTSIPPPPPPPPRSRRILTYLTLSVFCTALGFAMAAAPAFQTAREIAAPITDEETMLLFVPEASSMAEEVNNHLLNHSLVQSLLEDPQFRASRPHLKIPPSLRPNNLTGGTLLGADKIAVPPLAFVTEDGSKFVSLQYLGPALCGHPGLIHGGLLATLLDEGLARCCFPALPNKVGVTASLKIDYRKPCKAEQYVVLKAETTKVEGRKAWVKGRLETLVDESKGEIPEVLVEAEALFIEPKQAATMARVYSTQ